MLNEHTRFEISDLVAIGKGEVSYRVVNVSEVGTLTIKSIDALNVQITKVVPLSDQARLRKVNASVDVDVARKRLGSEIVDAIIARSKCIPERGTLIAYITRGGTYIIASHPAWNDNGKPGDLVAIGRFGDVVVLSQTASPEMVDAVRAVVAAS